MKKTIILIMPHHFNIYEGFVKNLEKLGFEIELLFTSNQDFRYKNTLQKVTNFFRKTFLGDKKYKQNLKAHYDDESLAKALSKIDKKVDYTLVIRPDYFSVETLQLLKNKTHQLVAYQWDGLDRYPKVKNLIPLFDRFFLFDVDDFHAYKSVFSNVYPITNFYFDFDNDISESNNKEVFFIGSFIENRIDEIVNFSEVFKKLHLKTNINVLYFDDETPLKYKETGINFIAKGLTYLEVLEEVKKAGIVLDFANSIHNGLSFRTFEALCFSRKLITNNPLVKKYDFYSKNNILVWDKDTTLATIQEFVSKDYEKNDENMIRKYSFTNWLYYIFEINPHTKIENNA